MSPSEGWCEVPTWVSGSTTHTRLSVAAPNPLKSSLVQGGHCFHRTWRRPRRQGKLLQIEKSSPSSFHASASQGAAKNSTEKYLWGAIPGSRSTVRASSLQLGIAEARTPASSSPGSVSTTSCGSEIRTFERGGTECVSQTLPPTTEPLPMTVLPPSTVAPA